MGALLVRPQIGRIAACNVQRHVERVVGLVYLNRIAHV